MSLTFSADGPYPLIPIASSNYNFHDYSTFAQWFSIELSLTHNVIIRALNSIWLNAPLVPPEDVKDFTGYGLACMAMIHAHHATQEQVVFPRLQERIDMRMNVVQHLAFNAALQDMETYLLSVHDQVEQYDYEKILQLRENLGRDLVQHLHSEIETVSPKRIYAFTKQELKNLGHAIEDHKRNFRDSATLFPFMVTNHCKEDAADWFLRLAVGLVGMLGSTGIDTTGNFLRILPKVFYRHTLLTHFTSQSVTGPIQSEV